MSKYSERMRLSSSAPRAGPSADSCGARLCMYLLYLILNDCARLKKGETTHFRNAACTGFQITRRERHDNANGSSVMDFSPRRIFPQSTAAVVRGLSETDATPENSSKGRGQKCVRV
eukprot:6178393-Pleurochrysis_carterae.AAC.3